MEVAIGRRKKLNIFGADYKTKDGTGIRDYIHVTDLAEAHLKALKYLANHRSLTVNLGSAKGYSVKEVLALARQITGCKIPAKIAARRLGDPAALYASSQTAQKVLNYQPKYSDLETIIKTTWKVYKKNLWK